ncbi:MAG: DNA alkylation repair protein [Alphaproteobacteria bacterium]|nr:DNA alkylation repair protein [Alphaproteobacteria bacterium]
MTGETATVEAVLAGLSALGREENRLGKARYGINVERAFGVGMAELRAMARRYRRQHALAVALWDSGWSEARHLAVLIADPRKVDDALMEAWVADFDSWDVCDGACMHLFARVPGAHDKVRPWAAREETYARRAGFALLAGLAVHDKRAPDAAFIGYLELIEAQADDERNFVRKAVNWALRQIGKRNLALNAAAIVTAERLAARPAKAARWIARDALKELQSPAVQARLRTKRCPPL